MTRTSTIKELLADYPLIIVGDKNRNVAGAPLCLRPILGEPVLTHTLAILDRGTTDARPAICVVQVGPEGADSSLANSAWAGLDDLSAGLRRANSIEEVSPLLPDADCVVIWAAETVQDHLTVNLPRIPTDLSGVVEVADATGSTIAVFGPLKAATRVFLGDRTADINTVACDSLKVLHWWHDLAEAEDHLRESVISRLLAGDVYIQRRDLVSIGLRCRIDSGVTLLGNIDITGRSTIESGAVVEGPTRLHDVHVGAGARIVRSTLAGSRVPHGVSIGPYAVLNNLSVQLPAVAAGKTLSPNLAALAEE